MKILLIEDQVALSKSISGYLINEGHICETAMDYGAALAKINIYNYDCILLDLSLPGGDGMDILSELRKMKKADGLIIISAKDALDDKLKGLTLGADDYLVKPFHLSELHARILSLMRRKNFDGSNIIQYNELNIDTLSKTVKINDHVIVLTKKEYDLLLFFISNKNKVVSKMALAEHLWGDETDLADHFDFIYTHIKNLRKKMVEAGAADYIKSMYGVGYKFDLHETRNQI